MGWFDEQIRARRDADLEALGDSFENMASSVMGRGISDALNDDRQITADAIGEILKYYHVKPREIPEKQKDMNEILEYLLRPYGIMRRSVRLEKGWYQDASGAMLGTKKNDGTVVALCPCGVNGYHFYDRKSGRWVRLNRKTNDLIEPEAIAFYKPFPLSQMTGGSLMKYIFRQISAADILLLVLCMLAATGVGLLLPWLTNMLFSDVILSGSLAALAGIAVFMVCATVSSILFSSVKALLTARIGLRLNHNVEAAAMMRILSMPASFFKNYSAGELASRTQYINGFCSEIVSISFSSCLSFLFSLIYLIQISRYAPSLVVPALSVALLTLMIAVIHVLVETRITRKKMENAGKENGMSYQLFSGVQKIRLSGAENRAFAKWGNLYARVAEKTYDPPLFLKISSVITLAVSLIGTLVIYAAAVKSGVSVSEYYAFASAFGMVSTAFTTLAGVAKSAGQIRPILDMAKPVLETMPEISEDKQVVTRISGGVELNNVSFRYEEDGPAILDNLSLKIRPGQYVAIVGKTGCGKSTLMRIMLGFETPQKGAVYYDGLDIKKLDLKSLRRRIGAVMQNGKLSPGDIFSNITITAPHLSVEEAWEAAEIAGLAEDIRRMPMGMQTMISEGQGGISGGQRQRLLIARAVAPKPKILMFDEATSSLDNMTQRQVSEALDRMKCTRIVIAHRLSTIRQCSRILVLDQGKIVEDGSYEELVSKNGAFADLVARQQLNLSEGR